MNNGCYVELAVDDWLEQYEPNTLVAFSKEQHMCDVELDLDLLRSTRVEDERRAFVPVVRRFVILAYIYPLLNNLAGFIYSERVQRWKVCLQGCRRLARYGTRH